MLKEVHKTEDRSHPRIWLVQSASVPRVFLPPAQALHRLRPQQLAPWHRYVSVCMATAAEDSAPVAAPVAERKPEAVTPGWQTAIDLLQSGKVFSPKIVAVNRSGVVVLVGKLNGFIPYKLMDKAKLPTTPFDPEAWSKSLVGTKLTVKVGVGSSALGMEAHAIKQLGPLLFIAVPESWKSKHAAQREQDWLVAKVRHDSQPKVSRT